MHHLCLGLSLFPYNGKRLKPAWMPTAKAEPLFVDSPYDHQKNYMPCHVPLVCWCAGVPAGKVALHQTPRCGVLGRTSLRPPRQHPLTANLYRAGHGVTSSQICALPPGFLTMPARLIFPRSHNWRQARRTASSSMPVASEIERTFVMPFLIA